MEPIGLDWHAHTKTLISVFLGRISSNIRLISLRFVDEMWKVRVILEEEDPDELRAIDEIAEDYVDALEDLVGCWTTFDDVQFSPAIEKELQFEAFASKGDIIREQPEQLLWFYRRHENTS